MPTKTKPEPEPVEPIVVEEPEPEPVRTWRDGSPELQPTRIVMRASTPELASEITHRGWTVDNHVRRGHVTGTLRGQPSIAIATFPAAIDCG